jgi:hypothetical protein
MIGEDKDSWLSRKEQDVSRRIMVIASKIDIIGFL